MAKKKKTRQQKIIADSRRQLFKENLSSQKTQVINLDVPQEIISKPHEEKTIDTSYNYLISDLRKTAFLTTSIVALQIILFLALTNKLLILPGLSY